MRVLVPFDCQTPKTRLAPVLDDDGRHAFARAMFDDVLSTVREAGHDPTVLATGPLECSAPVTVDERPLTAAVNDALASASRPVTVVVADLALLTPDAVTRLTDCRGDVVVSPGLGGGTNALVVRHPEFRVDYHGVSYRDHCERARAVGAEVTTVDSFRLSVDVDEPSDLVEVLLHADGAASDWLREAGFTLVEREGRTVAAQSADLE